MSIYCEACEGDIKKSGWGKHLKTRKHNRRGIGELVLEEREKTMLEM